MPKRFFYVCAGLFLLALSYHLGARSAGAQAPGESVIGIAANTNGFVALMSNGNTYYSIQPSGPWDVGANVFSGAPVTSQPQTFGQIKDRYRK